VNWQAKSAVPLTGDSCWITWEQHQRSRSLTSQLLIPLIELSTPGGRLKRYLRNSFATVARLRRGRYQTVFVQAPSLVLGVLAIPLAAMMKFRLIVDAHNAIIEGAESGRQPLRSLYRLLVRRADIVIVTNSALAQRLRKLGGRPGILPDPVPEFRSDAAVHGERGRIVVISTWAEDEPLEAIIAAAELLPEPLTLTITGRPRGPLAEMARRCIRLQLCGFVPDAEYLKMLANAAVVVDLTTREDCLVCGAYEALAMGRPLVVSESHSLRELLGAGAQFTVNKPTAIARTIIEAYENQEEWAARCAARREAYLVEWRDTAMGLLQQIAAAQLVADELQVGS